MPLARLLLLFALLLLPMSAQAQVAPMSGVDPFLAYLDGGIWHLWSDLIVFHEGGVRTKNVVLNLPPGADGLPLIGLYDPYPVATPEILDPSVMDAHLGFILHHYNQSSERTEACQKAQVHVRVSDGLDRYNSVFVFLKVPDSGRRCP